MKVIKIGNFAEHPVSVLDLAFHPNPKLLRR